MLRQEAWHTRRKPREKFEKRVSAISRRCSWASCLCKRRCHRTSHLTAHCKRNQSRGFLASWGIVCKETASMEAQRPEAACDPRVAARFDFASPRLMLGPHYNISWQGSKPNVLSSRTHSRSQVKLSALIWINCRQTTVQVALAGPGTLVTLVVATSCTLLLERKLCSANSNAPQRCRWISQSKGSATILKPQEAFPQLSEAVAVACVMSAARDQLVTRIPDATPGLKFLGRLCSTSTRGSWQIIPRMGRKKVDKWRHRAELVNQGATLVFWCSCPALVNDCTMHDAFIWRAAIK